ncbi:MAG: FAD/NAD(P)-binding protein [Phycisphaerales bacterium]|nr:FAD/NAD(P)-binding protein [Phycisphaerales bacterium]
MRTKQKTVTIAFIGCGFSATAILYNFEKQLPKKIYGQVHILLFEKRKSFGDGIAYQTELKKMHLNSPINHSSVNTDDNKHFENWLIKKHQKQPKYIERSVFGTYLIANFQKSTQRLTKKGVIIEKITGTVEHIQKYKNQYLIQITDYKKIWHTDYLLLTTGVNIHKNIYQLSSDRYINDIYYTPNLLKAIKKDDKVLILGSGDSALDLINYFYINKHQGKLYIYSRSNTIAHSSQIHLYKPYIELTKNFLKPLVDKKKIALTIIVQFCKEKMLQLVNNNPKLSLQLDGLPIEQKAIEKEIRSKGIVDLIFLAIAMNKDDLEYLWSRLSTRDKRKFYKLYYLQLRKIVIHTPRYSLKNMLSLLKTSQLISLNNKPISIKETPTGSFTIKYPNQETTIDWVINATGPAPDIRILPLYQVLLKQKLIAQNPIKGIAVDPDTFQCLTINQKIQKKIFALSPCIFGSVFLPYGIKYLANAGKKLATHLIKEIARNGD